MSIDRSITDVPRGLIRGIGSRAAAATRWPLGEAEKAAVAALNSERIRDLIKDAIDSDAAKDVIAHFFKSGLFEEFVDGLLASPALWRLVDEIAASPAVTAAITQQSLGFADQVEEEVRMRSRGADDWLEQKVRRLARRRQRNATAPANGPEAAAPSEATTAPAARASRPPGEKPERDGG